MCLGQTYSALITAMLWCLLEIIHTFNCSYLLLNLLGITVTKNMTRLATLNARSIKNKDHLIVNELNDNTRYSINC